MSNEEKNNQINDYKEKIMKIKKEAKKRKISIREERNVEIDPKIEDLEAQFISQTEKIKEITNKIQQLQKERKKEKMSLRPLSIQISNLSKQKSNEIKNKIKKIDIDKKEKIKIIMDKIKVLRSNK